MYWTFYVVVFIFAAFFAVMVATAIMAPIKRKREDKRWKRMIHEMNTGLR
jgi:hypothetical protein